MTPRRSAYARVDVVEAGGALVLMELELIDPFLALACEPPSAESFARAIDARLAGANQ